MMTIIKNNSVILKINTSQDYDAEEIERLTIQLRRDIEELDVEEVTSIKGDASPPPGSKSGDIVTLGSLLVTLAASGGVFTSLIDTLKSWLSRHQHNTITIEIGQDKFQVSGISSDDQQKLINSWIERQKQRDR